MNLALAVSLAHALTLEEAVARAAEVDPNALVAELTWRQGRLDAAEAWAAIGPTPSASLSRPIGGTTTTLDGNLSVSLPVLDASAYFQAAEQSAQARGSRHTADATRLDAQYAAAALYYTVLAAQAAVEAAQEGERFARATATATGARVASGLESELIGRSAQIELLQAQADLASAEAGLSIARAQLSRALQQPIDQLSPSELPDLPTGGGGSPWLRASEAALAAARLEHGEGLADLLPSAGFTASSTLASANWTLALTASWTFDGLAGPFLRARSAALSQRIAEVQYDALQRDFELGLVTANEQARAAGVLADAGRAREELANESLRVGGTRLEVGLASSLEVLRLQDEAADARADRVSAELGEALARLEARRVSGVGW